MNKKQKKPSECWVWALWENDNVKFNHYKKGGFGPRFKKRGPKMPNAAFFKNGA